MRLGRLTVFAAPLLVAVLAACADEAAAPTPEEEASTATPGSTPAPAPPAPELPAGAQEVGRNRLSFSLGAGTDYVLDPSQFELTPGSERPPCEALVFAYGWQVIEPAPAPADVQLVWTYQDGAAEEVGRGASGTATVGCGTLTAANETNGDVIVVIDYVIGSNQ